MGDNLTDRIGELWLELMELGRTGNLTLERFNEAVDEADCIEKSLGMPHEFPHFDGFPFVRYEDRSTDPNIAEIWPAAIITPDEIREKYPDMIPILEMSFSLDTNCGSAEAMMEKEIAKAYEKDCQEVYSRRG